MSSEWNFKSFGSTTAFGLAISKIDLSKPWTAIDNSCLLNVAHEWDHEHIFPNAIYNGVLVNFPDTFHYQRHKE